MLNDLSRFFIILCTYFCLRQPTLATLSSGKKEKTTHCIVPIGIKFKLKHFIEMSLKRLSYVAVANFIS